MTENSLSPDAMRARADQLKASARDSARAAFDADRQAAQLAWEAGLVEAAGNARAELKGTAQRLERLKKAVVPLITAERQAQDRLRDEQQHRDDRIAQLAAAEADGSTPTEALEDLDIRIGRSRRRVSEREDEVRAARRGREAAESERDDCQAQLNELVAESKDADRKAASPGVAPGSRGLAPGVAGVSDMDEDTRNLIAAAVLLAALVPAPPASPALSSQVAGGWNARADLARMDPSRPRAWNRGTDTVIIPPALMPGGPGR